MYLFHNLFNEEQIKELENNVNNATKRDSQDDLGRLNIDLVTVPYTVRKTLFQAIRSITDEPLDTYRQCLCVIYSNEYGDPRLPPHYDGDNTEFVVDYQLKSNTRWDIGADLKTYHIEDNGAVIMRPNEQIHWRPHKKFNNGEFVTMMFFRFYNPVERKNYSHLNYQQSDPIFDEVKAFRDSI